LESDAEKARSPARQRSRPVHALEITTVNNWRRSALATRDFVPHGGSARFIDANVAWHQKRAIRKRNPGTGTPAADHVLHSVDHPDGSRAGPDEKILRHAVAGERALAAALDGICRAHLHPRAPDRTSRYGKACSSDRVYHVIPKSPRLRSKSRSRRSISTQHSSASSPADGH